MKIAAQRSDELARMARLIDGMSVAMLTHASAEGYLVSCPMTPLELDARVHVRAREKTIA